VDAFRSDALFEDIQFIDFYRYCDVSLSELYAFLDQNVPWVRPSDSGRSTNGLINDLGIYLHKKQRGYHNYALPYSWDVRMGHKQREEALKELHDEIDEARIKRMMQEIGYTEPNLNDDPSAKRLAAYYVSDALLTTSDLRAYLNHQLPDYMLPTYFIRLEALPLTRNGKIDRAVLPDPQSERPDLASRYQPPDTPLEKQLATIWSKALNLSQIGVNDNFFELGGSSLPAIQVIYQVNRSFGIELPVQRFFENPTISQISTQIEDLLIAQIADMSDDDAARLLATIQ
jgi:acyl carrier protein